VQAQLAPLTRGVLDAEVEGRDGITPYASWVGHFQLWPLVLLAAALIASLGRWKQPSP
jgi:apolipoprotein N-acyltransferase